MCNIFQKEFPFYFYKVLGIHPPFFSTQQPGNHFAKAKSTSPLLAQMFELRFAFSLRNAQRNFSTKWANVQRDAC